MFDEDVDWVRWPGLHLMAEPFMVLSLAEFGGGKNIMKQRGLVCEERQRFRGMSRVELFVDVAEL